MNVLHSTTDPDLLTRLKQMMAHADKADIAVGYFFVSGFNAVCPEIGHLEKVRLLVGRTDRQTLEEVAAGIQQAEALRAKLSADETVRRSKRDEVAAQSVTSIATGVSQLPQTGAAESDVKALREVIAAGRMEIRTYPKGRLHAKAYLCWYPDHAEPGAAVVGSSNFSLAGFTGNTELNVRVTGDAEMAELKRWYEALWADSVDITDDIAIELDRSWALAKTPPYHVYLKALYELYKDQLLTPELEVTRRGGPELADFQLDAVRRGLRMIDLHGGCFIGDVVGLGKTYIGAELLRQLAYTERGKPLIICPAGLIPMWERVNEMFNLGAEVESMSIIVPPAGLVFDEELEVYADDDTKVSGVVLADKYPNRGPVLIDEVHNFRNPLARRYKAIRNYLDEGDHKVVLLSATPQNLGPKDIYHQLRLFLDDIDHDLKIEPLRLEDYFNAVQKWYEYRIEFENWQQDYSRWQLDQRKAKRKIAPPVAPDEPKVPYATIDQVLNPTFIRRRRRDIKELYGDEVYVSGKKVNFIEPTLDNLPYRLDRVYAKAGPIEELQHRLGEHRGVRYLAADYLRAEKRGDAEYKDLLRARNRIAALIRHLLFKRLESSVAAFRSTLDMLIRSNRNFRESLDEGFVPIGQTATRLLGGEAFDPDDLLEVLQTEEERRKAAGAKRSKLVHSANDFETDRWKSDLDADFEVLDEIRTRVEPITAADDDKLQALKDFLAQPEVASGKLIIFSEAETTIHYLFEELNPGGGDASIAVASGETRDQLQSIVKRFAPTSNLKEGERLPGPEVRILLATDIVSEGQNLQDCNRVLNYDLHWNPVRLIQRFGRVDRIGTTHTDIYLNNMWPDLAVDQELDLTERLLSRIQAFHDFIGLDSKLLSAKERINPGAMYRIYAEKKYVDEDDVLDEVATFQRGINLLQKLQEDDPDLWETIVNLPNGIRSALAAREKPATEAERERFIQNVLELDIAQLPLASPEVDAGVERGFADPSANESVVLVKTGDVTGSFAVGTDLKARPITPGQLIASVECGPGEPAKPLPEDTNDRVMAAFNHFQREVATRLGKARRPGSDTRLRRYLSKHLNLAREDFKDDASELQRIGVLQRIFLDHLPANVMNELAEVRKMQLEGTGLIRRLEALRMHFKLNPREEEDDAGAANTEVIQIVCSDGLV